jgi:hypothetical protein
MHVLVGVRTIQVSSELREVVWLAAATLGLSTAGVGFAVALAALIV